MFSFIKDLSYVMNLTSITVITAIVIYFIDQKKIEKELDDCNAWYLCIVPSNGSKDKVVFRSIADRDLTMVGARTR